MDLVRLFQLGLRCRHLLLLHRQPIAGQGQLLILLLCRRRVQDGRRGSAPTNLVDLKKALKRGSSYHCQGHGGFSSFRGSKGEQTLNYPAKGQGS